MADGKSRSKYTRWCLTSHCTTLIARVKTHPRFAIFLLATTAAPALAAVTEAPVCLAIAPPPDWVQRATPSQDKVEGALVVDLLMYSQVRLIEGGIANCRSNLYHIVTAQGQDTCALQINWDPSLQRLTIHHYRVVLALALARVGADNARALTAADTVLGAKHATDGQRWLAWSARGAVLLRQTNYAGSIAAHSPVIAANRTNHDALVGRGSAYLGHDQPGLATATTRWRPLIKRSPMRPMILARVCCAQPCANKATILAARWPISNI